ncbi:MAG: hypothetical protein H8E25_09290 [Planctomycetes bacterium]|nr:hypothetical protein [Planctomycetota bacterium]
MLSESVPSGRIRQGNKQLELSATGAVDLVANLASNSVGRDMFLRPSADQPLATLLVPFPRVPVQSVLLPPPTPSPGTQALSSNLFVRPFALPGDINTLPDSSTSGEDLATEIDSDIEIDMHQGYRAQFDHVRVNAVTTFYGQIVNEKRYELQNGDNLLFVEYDVTSGRERFSVRPIAGDDYQSFGFAETLRNKVELDYRQERRGLSAGSLAQTHDFVDWLLANGMSEPIAFTYAKDLALRAAELDPNDPLNWMHLAQTYEATLDFDQAFSVYALMVGDSVDGEFIELLIQAGLSAKRFAHISEPRVAMGLILQKLNLRAAARKQFELAMVVADGTSHAPMALGNMLFDEGLYTAARENLQRAYNKQANRSNPLGMQNGLDLARVMLAQSDWSAASDQYSSVLSLAVENSEFKAKALAGQITTLYLAGNFSDAQDAAEQAIIDVGATAQLLYLRGIATGANGGDIANVVADLNSAIAVQPLQAADYYAALAFYSGIAGDEIAAETALASALEQSPNHFYSRYLHAFRSVANGDLLGAQSEYEDLVKDNPDCAALLANYASLLLEQRAHTKAKVAFSRIASQLRSQTLSASSSEAWANVNVRDGINLLSLGEYDQALSAFDYSLSLDDSLHAARNTRAITMYASGELDVAVAEFSYLQDALRENVDHEQYVYASKWQARLQEHDKLRRWTDDFSAPRLRPGWDLQNGARAGIAPRHDDEKLIIEGHHEAAATTSVSRSVPGLAFRSFSGELEVAAAHRGSAGIAISLMNRSKTTWSFALERNREGRLSYAISRGTRSESKNTDINIAVGVPMTVSFSLNREPKQPILTVLVNNQIVYSDEVVALRNPTGRMESSFFAETAHALPLDVSLDNVELIYAQLK